MRRKFINKLILGTMVSTMIGTLVPVKASAEWVKDYQNNWYYTQNNVKLTGWKKIDGQLYYFDDDGKMQTGWIQAGNSWYFLQNSGALKTGWISYNKNLYYTDSSGVMQTGIINIEGKVYILGDNGVLKTGSTVISGQFYTIDSDGEVVGTKVPTPDKEFDNSGNVVTVLKNTDNNVTTSPTDSNINQVIKDESVSNDDPNEGRKFKVIFKDSNGAELKTESVKNGKTVDLYAPTKDGYKFGSWNTKSDGSGKSYNDSDSIKVKEDINLYAQWTEDSTVYVTSLTVKGSSSVQIGKTAQMTVDILPMDAGSAGVTWSVNNTNATIDSNGVLTGVTEGTVTVTATAKDGSGKSATKQITVGQTSVVVPVTSITVSSKTSATTITANGGTLQMVAGVLPEDAGNQEVTWTVENRTGSATISATGLLSAVGNGTVTVKATATDGSGIVGSETILLSGQISKTLVDGITLSSTSDTITTNGQTLQISASVSPTNATNKDIIWSVDNNSIATISSTGLLKPVGNGTVTVSATAQDGSGKVGSKTITISNQVTQVTDITVDGVIEDTSGNITQSGIKRLIGPDKKTLQMIATVSPTDAANKDVTWSVQQQGDSGTNMTGRATIDSDGLLTAVSNGIVTVVATSKANSKVVGTKVIEISGQYVPVTGISVDGISSVNTITSDKGKLQMVAALTPTYTTQQAVTWSVQNGTDSNGTGQASIDDYGVLTAGANGTVLVIATSKDNTLIFGSKTITITGQLIKVSGISVSATTTTGAAVTITNTEASLTNDGGTLLMSASASPTDASDQSVTWSVENGKDLNGTGMATIASNGKVQAYLTAQANGQVLVKATANDGSGVVGTQLITITGQTVKVTGITVNSEGNATTIPIIGGTLKMSATVAPSNAYNPAVTWSVDKTAIATIDSDGTLHGLTNGTVTVTATAKDGSGIVGTKTITVNGITGITITGGSTVVAGSTLQLGTNVSPNTVANESVTWSVVNLDTTQATHAGIDESGKLTASSAGTVVVTATAKDGSGVVGTANIIITP